MFQVSSLVGEMNGKNQDFFFHSGIIPARFWQETLSMSGISQQKGPGMLTCSELRPMLCPMMSSLLIPNTNATHLPRVDLEQGPKSKLNDLPFKVLQFATTFPCNMVQNGPAPGHLTGYTILSIFRTWRILEGRVQRKVGPWTSMEPSIWVPLLQ